METVKKETAAKTATTTPNNKATNNMRPNIPGKEANNEPAKDEKNAQGAQAAPAATQAPAATAAPAQAQQPADTAKPAEPVGAGEPSKKEIKSEFAQQHVRGLEDTVKLVETLGKKIAQKNKLFNTVSNLDTFVVAQSDDKDDVTADSKFPRCELVISDDDNNEFVTKNPFIIARVVDMVKQLCIEKLAEVEATIVIP